MKKLRILLILSVFIIVLAIPALAFASDVSVEADASRFFIGETVTVTITVSGEDMAVAQGTYAYDYNVLSYVSSTGGAADGQLNMISMQSGGASSMTAVVEFTAISAGEITVSVSIDDILDYDGNTLSPCTGSANITVVASNALTPSGDEETIPAFTLDGIAAANVYDTDATLYVWRSVMNLTLPSGFADTTVSYNGETIGGAISTGNSGAVLLYLSDIAGENAAYYLYDEDNNALYPYVSIRSTAQTFTFLWPDASVTTPDGYVETTIDVDGIAVPAWSAEGSDGTVYLVYGLDASGNKAIYQYIPNDQSLQRYIASITKGSTSLSSGVDSNVFLALCVVCGILFVSVIALLILHFAEQKEKREIIAFSKKRISELQEEKGPPYQS